MKIITYCNNFIIFPLNALLFLSFTQIYGKHFIRWELRFSSGFRHRIKYSLFEFYLSSDSIFCNHILRDLPDEFSTGLSQLNVGTDYGRVRNKNGEHLIKIPLLHYLIFKLTANRCLRDLTTAIRVYTLLQLHRHIKF